MSDFSLTVACAGDHIGEIGHELRAMEYDPHRQVFRCRRCPCTATPERARQAIPNAYAWSDDVIVRALQSMADYRLIVTFGRGGPRVEYPRPSLDEARR